MNAYRSSLFAGVALATVAGVAQAQTPTPAPVQINFSIASGPLGGALNAYASQAGRQLMFTSDQVAGRRTQGLSGRMTPDEALNRLLAGSGLTAVRSTSGAWVLQRATTEELAATTLEEVVVTGTLLRGPGDTPSPVTVIRREDLDRTGRATVAEALAALPQNYAGSGTPTAALVGSDPMQSNSGLATGVNLRGLGPDSTLVLVNGRRMAGAGGRGDFADVSAVPTAAVERVDVLLDGASALYGADAVGGVVNIILRRDFDGQESRIRVGASEGGAESVIAAHTWGRTWSNGQFLASYEFERQNALSTLDRPYTATGDLRPFGGTDHRTYYSAPGNLVRFDSASGGYVVTHAIRPGSSGVATSPSNFAAGQQNYGNTRVGGALTPEFDRQAAYVYARQSIGAHLEVTGDLRFSQRDFETESLTPTTIATVTSANSHFVSPTGAASHSVAYAFGEDLGASRRSGRSRSLGATLGARAFLPAGWEAEAFLTYGAERSDDQRTGMLQSTFLQEALGNTADNPATPFSVSRDGYLNLFGSGAANNRAVLDFISSGWSRYTDESEVASANLIVQGAAFQLPGGDLTPPCRGLLTPSGRRRRRRPAERRRSGCGVRRCADRPHGRTGSSVRCAPDRTPVRPRSVAPVTAAASPRRRAARDDEAGSPAHPARRSRGVRSSGRVPLGASRRGDAVMTQIGGGGFDAAIRPGLQVADGVDDASTDLPIERAGAVAPVLLERAAGQAQMAGGFGRAEIARRHWGLGVVHGGNPCGAGTPSAADGGTGQGFRQTGARGRGRTGIG